MVDRTLRGGVVVALMVLLLPPTGCADPGKTTPPDYRPVMTIRARAPLPVEVGPLVPAKPDLAEGARFVENALADELSHAGFTVTRVRASDAPAPGAAATARVIGTLKEYRTDMGMSGYRTRMRVTFVVSKGGVAKLDKSFAVDEGGSGLTGSRGEFEEVIRGALEILMRRAVPDIIAAIEG